MGINPTSTRFPALIVLNPNSGKKQAREALETVVQPALEKAGIPFRAIESLQQGHIQSYFQENIQPILVDLVQSLSSVSSDGASVVPPSSATLQVIILGGDGSVHEVVNGILRGVEGTEFVSEAFRPKVEFSVIPLGTGNSIATSLGIKDVRDALDRFIAGKTVPLRLISVATRSQKGSSDLGPWKTLVYTVVVNSYGLHCATVYDSEEFRHLGNERFRQAAMKNIETLKQYEGQLTLHGPGQRYDQTSRTLVQYGQNLDAKAVATSLDGPFTYLLITKQASLEPGFTPTPFASTSDEWMDVLVVQNVGQQDILNLFGSTSDGSHVDQKIVEYYKSKLIELETPEKARLCVDGEFLDIQGGPQGRVQFEVTEDPNLLLFSVYT
ncbi:hypothetical protein BGW38_001853 [Lunasporangiospora selenospora]|uniref:DAGKc domain-containing protein n=1 Tax=Lunasporangiospora selenospora TaxID=979761 RepID=A0A9P6KDT1_9FUNG|nr:hypothetical protein BGW38_001853 [Lunasporangiospora selenospora]